MEVLCECKVKGGAVPHELATGCATLPQRLAYFALTNCFPFVFIRKQTVRALSLPTGLDHMHCFITFKTVIPGLTLCQVT